jgi:hypothetical protein
MPTCGAVKAMVNVAGAGNRPVAIAGACAPGVRRWKDLAATIRTRRAQRRNDNEHRSVLPMA